MKITRQQHTMVADDGAAARHGLGAFVPALLVGVGFAILWPAPLGQVRWS